MMVNDMSLVKKDTLSCRETTFYEVVYESAAVNLDWGDVFGSCRLHPSSSRAGAAEMDAIPRRHDDQSSVHGASRLAAES